MKTFKKLIINLINFFKKWNLHFLKNRIFKITTFGVFITSMIAGVAIISVKSTFNYDSYKSLSPDYGDSLKINMQINDKYEHSYNHLSLNQIVNKLYGQTDQLGLKNITINTYGTNGINVTVPGKYNQFEQRRLVDYITTKPTLTFRDETDKSLFSNGSYDTGGQVYHKDDKQNLPFDLSNIKIKNNSMTNKSTIMLKLKSPYSVSTTKIDNLLSGIKGKSNLVFWLGYEGLYNSVYNTPAFKDQSTKTLYNFVQSVSPSGAAFGKPQTMYDENEIFDYNKKGIPSVGQLIPSQPSFGNSEYFIINNPNWGTNNKLVSNIANRIKYSANKFTFKTISVSKSGSSYSHKRIVFIFTTIGIIMLLILMWLVWSYGTLGLVTSLSLLLVGLANIAVFNTIGGEISNGSIITFCLLFILLAAISAWQLNIFKKEIKSGSKTEYALNRSRRNSLSMVLDLKFLLMLTTFTFFYFTIGLLENISIMSMFLLLLSTAGLLVLNRCLIYLLASTKFVKDKWLCGAINNKFSDKITNIINTTTKKVVTFFNFKWFKLVFISSFAILISAGTVFILATSLMHNNFSSSFALGSDFKTKYDFNVVLKANGGDDHTLATQNKITNSDVSKIRKDLKNAKINIYSADLSVETIYFYDADQNLDTNKTKKMYTYSVSSTTKVTLNQINTAFKSDNFVVKDYGNNSAIQKVQNTLFGNYIKRLFFAIVMAMIPGVVYLIFRFRWSSAIAILKCLIINILGFFSIAAIFRIPINFTFIEVVLFILLINLSLGTFMLNLIRSKSKINEKDLQKSDLKRIVNEVQTNFKPFLIKITIVMLAVVIVIACVIPVQNLPVLILLLFTILFSSLLAYNLLPKLWVFLENYRLTNHRKIKSMKLTKVNEQIFKNIND